MTDPEKILSESYMKYLDQLDMDDRLDDEEELYLHEVDHGWEDSWHQALYTS